MRTRGRAEQVNRARQLVGETSKQSANQLTSQPTEPNVRTNKQPFKRTNERSRTETTNALNLGLKLNRNEFTPRCGGQKVQAKAGTKARTHERFKQRERERKGESTHTLKRAGV